MSSDKFFGFEFRHQYEEGAPEILVRVDKDADLAQGEKK